MRPIIERYPRASSPPGTVWYRAAIFGYHAPMVKKAELRPATLDGRGAAS